MSLKCADVSNPCRPWESCRQWAYRICEEFFCQGDKERLLWSLIPSKGFERTGSSVPAIQLAFIDNCIRPLFTLWHEFFQSHFTEQLLNLLDSNYIHWKRRASEKELKSHSLVKQFAESVSAHHAHFGEKPSGKLFFSWTPNTTIFLNPVTHKCAAGALTTLDVTQFEQSLDPGISTKMEGESKECLRTFFITTSGLRRHSLPETQGAIKKTFSFAPFKKSNASHYAIETPVSSSLSGIRNNDIQPTVRCVYLTSSSFRPFRTASGIILQTLCEELINQEPNAHKSPRAFELDPFPLPDAWNTDHPPFPATTATATSAVGTYRPSYLTKVAINFSSHQFMASAHRRSSVPLLDR